MPGLNVDFDLQMLARGLEAASVSGLLSRGMAHRVGVAAHLASACALGGAGMDSAIVSGQELAERMGLSRAAVHKHVRCLQSLGFDIKSAPGRGYRLDSPFADLVAAEAFIPHLLGSSGKSAVDDDLFPYGRTPEGQALEDASMVRVPTLGLPYVYLERCESTNLVLREALAFRGEFEGSPNVGWSPHRRGTTAPPNGTVVVTDEQIAGRGRLNRTWSSLPGADLTFSVLVRPSLAPGEAHLLSLTAGLAIAEALETLPGFEGDVAIKWPNDVLLGEKKVCGVLLEGLMDAERMHWGIVGIGLNVNSFSSALMNSSIPQEVAAWAGRPEPVSLREHLGSELPRAPLLALLLRELDTRWKALEGGGSVRAEILDELHRRDALAGCLVEVSKTTGSEGATIIGEARGFGPEGQLLVRQASGTVVSLFAGEVTVRKYAQADPKRGRTPGP